MASRAIVFDIGGVLEISLDGREPTAAFGEMVARWESRLGIPSGSLLAHLVRVSRGGLIDTYSIEEWRRDLRTAAGLSESDGAAFETDFWDLYLGTFNEALAAHLRSLRPRYRTALLSNSFVDAREKEHARYGLGDLAELIVYSHEVGIAKPDRRIYELTCERLEVRPEEVIFLDDVEAYVAGARDAGMNAILYRDNAQAIAAIEGLLA